MHPRVFPPVFLSSIRPGVLMDIVLAYETGWEGKAVQERVLFYCTESCSKTTYRKASLQTFSPVQL